MVAPPGAQREPLTSSERDVLQLLAHGASNRELADALVVSPNTVKRHISNICGKLGATNRTQAVIYALANGLLTHALERQA